MTVDRTIARRTRRLLPFATAGLRGAGEARKASPGGTWHHRRAKSACGTGVSIVSEGGLEPLHAAR